MVNRINLLMQAKNLTARQFAEEIGIQPSGMSHILSGRNNPSLDFVMKVIRRWPEINISWLMFGTEEMYASLPLNAPQSAVLSVQKPQQQPSAQAITSQTTEDNDAQPIVQGGGAYDLFSQPEPQMPEKAVRSAEPQSSPAINVEEEVSEPPQHIPSQPATYQAEPVSYAVSQAKPSDEAAAPEKTQPNENRIYESPKPAMPPQPVLAKKRIVKMIVLYEDHSFAEYYPE